MVVVPSIPTHPACCFTGRLILSALFHPQVLSELQSEIPGALIANNDDDIRLDAVMFESYNNDAASLQQLMQAVAAGRLVQVCAAQG